MPYLDATQSGVTITSMEFDCPIIASDTGGLKEQLNNGKIGVFCKPGDVESLEKAMLTFIKYPEEFEKQRKLMADFLHTLDRDVVASTLIRELR